MIKKLSQSLGLLLTFCIIAIIAVVSLFSPEKIQTITHSKLFLVFGVIIIIRSLAAVVSSLRNKSTLRRSANIIIHLGIVISLTGVILSERSTNNGYVFLELGQGGKNFYLNKNYKTIDELPGIIQLDSITNKYLKAFNPAPVIWLHYYLPQETIGFNLTYNKPFSYHGCQFLYSTTVEPGFPHSYAVMVNNEEYLLLHNQHLQLPDKKIAYSHAYDAVENRLGFIIDRSEYWLQSGETKQIDNCTITLESADFSRNHGVILLVKDINLRIIIYAGFGFVLLGLFIYLFDKRKL